MRTPLDAFQRRVAEIEALFAAGEIGPETRRALLVRARDSHGVHKLQERAGKPLPIGTGKIANMNDEQYRAMRSSQDSRSRRNR